jgi:hypothetical protein
MLRLRNVQRRLPQHVLPTVPAKGLDRVLMLLTGADSIDRSAALPGERVLGGLRLPPHV